MRPIITDVALSFWRLLPANPIVVRVVHGGSKRAQHLWVRGGYLVVLLLVMLATQLAQGDSSDSLVERAKTSTRVFELISILQLGMMCFLAPVFTAGAITQEKDAETFNVLLTTPLTNAQIVLGSLLSRLFFVIMLLLSGLPIFCITMLYGGVTAHQIFLSFGIAGCTAVLTGSLAILTSIMRVGTRGTVFSFYAGIALFLFGGLALGYWPQTHVLESIPPGAKEGMSWLAPFHPILALMVALNQTPPPDALAVQHYGWPFNTMLASPHTAYMWLTLLGSTVMVVLATFFVRRGARLGELNWWTRLWRKWVRTTTNGERIRRARRVWSNPVAWREAATRGSAASSSLARYGYIVCGVVAAALLLIFHHAEGSKPGVPARDWLSGVVLIEFVTVMLMAINAAATAITREREDGTMELLLSTPLTSRYIVWGKLRGLVSFTIPLMAVPAGTVLLLAIHDLAFSIDPPVVSLGSALLLCPLLLVYSALTCILGLQMSLKSKRSVQAVLASVGILVVVGFGLGLCALGSVSAAGPLGALLAPLTFVTAVWIVLNPDFVVDQMRLATRLPTPDVQVYLVIGTIIAIGLYSAIVVGIYKSMVRDFDMIVRKQSR